MSEKLQKRVATQRKLRHLFSKLLIVMMVFAFGLFVGYYARFFTPLSSANKLEEIKNIMETKWLFHNDVENLDKTLLENAARGMTTTDDPYTTYLSADDLNSFQTSLNHNYVGIGVEYKNSDQNLIITRVFPGSPAQKAGVMEGDIIYAIDNERVEGLTTSQVRDKVIGEKGTVVTIDFLRNGKTVTLKITRDNVSSTVTSSILENQIGYLKVIQFAQTSGNEMKYYLEDYQAKNISKVIIDLRDNGGGYLDTMRQLSSFFVEENQVIMQQEDAEGKKTYTKSTSGQFKNIKDIVILANHETASASEAFILALKENREHVTVVGTTTYGKGVAQITTLFNDGSAIKYTDSKWLSKNGVWINQVGITPDVEVELPEILSVSINQYPKDQVYHYDQVGEPVRYVQLALDYLGYEIDRKDGYFSKATETVLKQYQQAKNVEVTGVIDQTVSEMVLTDVAVDWNSSTAHDTQLLKAIEVLKS